MNQEKPSQEMLKGFNDGYLMEQFKPELSKSLTKAFEKRLDDYAFGFRDGAKQYQIEKAKKQTRNLTIDKEDIKRIEAVKAKQKGITPKR